MEARGRTAKATPQPRTSQLAAAAAAAAAEAMAARPSWGNVPDNILVRISAFLRCNADRVYMACASKLWSAAVRGLGRPPPPVLPPLPPLQPQLPWLIFPDTATPDVRRARCCGSGDGGWLVLALDSRHTHALYNLNTGRRIPLPPTFTTPADNDLPLVVRAATISAPPSDPGPYMVAAIVLVGNRSTAAFWSEGSESWFSTGALLDARPQDAIYHGGARTFFFVTSREDVVSFQPTYGWNNNVNLARVDYDMQPRGDYADDVGFLEETGLGTMRRYLVESRGRLLMVVRCFCYESGRTEVIRVFEFRVKPPAGNGQQPCATWKHLGTGLDGRMLFLGRGCSRSFEVARYNVFQESMIYFLDDGLVSVQSVDGRTLYSFTDMGRYGMEGIATAPWPAGLYPTMLPQPGGSIDLTILVLQLKNSSGHFKFRSCN